MAIDKITTPAIADDAVTNAKVSYNNNQFRNIIINGDMSIAQRATSATALGQAQYKTVDRWSQNQTGPMALTGEQSTDAPNGFDFSYKIACTTSEGSLAATSRMMPYYRVEDSNLGYLKFGTSSAVDLTMSFYIKSNKTGTYQINLWNNNISGFVSATYTIGSASTWEYKTITFKGDQGTAMGNDADVGMQLEFVLAAGSNYTGGTMVPNTTTTWPSYVANTRAANQGVNFADSTSNTWQITGLQLEVGSSASDFEYLPLDVNLQRCQRYFFEYGVSDSKLNNTGIAFNTGELNTNTSYPVFMRATPTLTFFDNAGNSGKIHRNGSGDHANAASAVNQNNKKLATVSSTSLTSGGGYAFRLKGDAEL